MLESLESWSVTTGTGRIQGPGLGGGVGGVGADGAVLAAMGTMGTSHGSGELGGV